MRYDLSMESAVSDDRSSDMSVPSGMASVNAASSLDMNTPESTKSDACSSMASAMAP